MNARSSDPVPKSRRSRTRRTKAAPAARKRIAVPILIAYSDIPAARHGIEQVRKLISLSCPTGDLLPMLWPLHQLREPRWNEIARRDAAHARAVVLALQDEASFDLAADWLRTLVESASDSGIKLLAFVGKDDAWVITLARSCSEPAARPNGSRVPAARHTANRRVRKRPAAWAA